jgi:hypothetical protein
MSNLFVQDLWRNKLGYARILRESGMCCFAGSVWGRCWMRRPSIPWQECNNVERLLHFCLSDAWSTPRLRKASRCGSDPHRKPGSRVRAAAQNWQNPFRRRFPRSCVYASSEIPGGVAHKQIVAIRAVRYAIVFSAEPPKSPEGPDDVKCLESAHRRHSRRFAKR